MADATRTRDDAPTLYERDFYLWCYRQAELLRLRRFAELERQSPSLERQAAAIVEGVYRRARKEAEIETGLPRSTFPPQIPYTLDELRDDDWMPA